MFNGNAEKQFAVCSTARGRRSPIRTTQPSSVRQTARCGAAPGTSNHRQTQRKQAVSATAYVNSDGPQSRIVLHTAHRVFSARYRIHIKRGRPLRRISSLSFHTTQCLNGAQVSESSPGAPLPGQATLGSRRLSEDPPAPSLERLCRLVADRSAAAAAVATY